MKYLILIGLINIYINYSYEYCYKYLTIKHSSVISAIFSASLNHLLFSMIIWVYLLLIFKPHEDINPSYLFDKRVKNRLKENEPLNRLIKELVEKRMLTLMTRSNDGEIRICLKCQLIQPDRCYHCKKCNRCILKRDHHCPWLGTCIGYSNQKYYHLFLIYLDVYFAFILFTTAISCLVNSDRIIENVENNCLELVNFKLCQFTIALSLVILQLLVINRFYLTSKNLTYVEYCSPPRLDPYYLPLVDENLFDLGCKWSNLEEVFGRQLLLAVFPVETSLGDGHKFPVNSEIMEITTV